MRESSPGARRGLRRRRHRPGRRRRRGRPRLHRHALLRLRLASTCPARCSPPATTRRSTTASSCAGPAPPRSGRTPGSPRSARWPRSDLDAAGAGRTGTVVRARPARRVRRLPARPRRPLRHPPAQGRRRRRQRHGRLHRAERVRRACRSTSCRCTSSSTASSRTTRPTRSTRRTWSTCRRRSSRRRRHRPGLRRRRRPLLRRRRARRAGLAVRRSPRWSPSASWPRSRARTIIHNLITSRAVPEIVARARRRAGAHPGRPLVHQGRDGRAPTRSSAASTPRHYYFRDFWRADSGMLAAMHVLAALGEQDGTAVAAARRSTRATSPRARSTPRSPTRPPPPRGSRAAFDGPAGRRRRRRSTG